MRYRFFANSGVSGLSGYRHKKKPIDVVNDFYILDDESDPSTHSKLLTESNNALVLE